MGSLGKEVRGLEMLYVECQDFCFCCLSWAFGSFLLASEPLVLKSA